MEYECESWYLKKKTMVNLTKEYNKKMIYSY